MPSSKSAKKRKRKIPEIPARLPHPIVDNHTHIRPDPASEQLVQNKDDDGDLLYPVLMQHLLTGMEQAGVRAAITSGCEVPELAPTLAMAQEYEQIFAALAIHPNEAAMHAGVREVGPDGLEHEPAPHHLTHSLDEAIAEVARLATEPGVVAIGETGLDYFRTAQGPGAEAQQESFRAHIALAKELGLPMQIHDREAHADVVNILRKDGAPERTVFHCFSGDRELAEICAEHGWYASFAGNVTFPVNKDLQEGFAALPDELVLVETDAPYLTPMPYRGHPNVVWTVALTAEFLAEQRGYALAEWCAVVDRNTRIVYDI